MQLMNLLMSVLPKTGSGSVSRFGTSLRLGILKISQSPAGTAYVKGEDAHRERILSASGKRRLLDSRRVRIAHPENSSYKEVISF